MVYKAIGLMSGSSLDGLDLVFVHILEAVGQWSYEIKTADCLPYDGRWRERLSGTTGASALEYCQLHADYGHFVGQQVNHFIEKNEIHLQMDLIASHGHTVFHHPENMMTAQLGDGAAIAAETGVAVISDLRNLDVAFGGQGAPLVPMGEKLLFPDYDLFLNLGGIANISFHQTDQVAAFDVCPANRVLNSLAEREGKPFDEGGTLARSGKLDEALLKELNAMEYYRQMGPKSLDNAFGLNTIIPIIDKYNLSTNTSLRTYTEHIAAQIAQSAEQLLIDQNPLLGEHRMLITGGGALNTFLINCLKEKLEPLGIEIVVPDEQTIQYKEAIIMALLGVLRWREHNTTLPSVTGASRESIGGALWMGQVG